MRTAKVAVYPLLLAVVLACQQPSGPAGHRQPATAGGQVVAPPQPAAHQPAEVPAVAQRPAETTLWERSRQCAAQAEKVMGRIEAEMAAGRASAYARHTPIIQKWENHYSPKFERCFVHVVYQNRNPDNVRDIPLFFDELIDAFENRVLSTGPAFVLGTGRSVLYCDIANDIKGDCDAARAFIDERMAR